MTDNPSSASIVPVTLIRPSRGWISLNLCDLWEYRELLYFLTWRDVKVRYKQTVLGAAWAIIQPFFTMVVFSLFFGKLAKMPSDDIPYGEWKMEDGGWRVEHSLAAALVAAGAGDLIGGWSVADGDERAVSRRALCGAFPGAGLS